MMREIKNIFFLVLLLTLLFDYQLGHGQGDDCEQTLRKALEEFNAGHFYGVSAILQPCIENGFTREQRQRAYLLLTQAYLLTDDPASAEDSYLKLLRANPEFVTDNARDPIDVVYLSKKFTSEPIISFFGKVGVNITPVKVIQDIRLSDSENSKKMYSIKPGWQISLGIDFNLSKRIALCASLQYMLTSYQRNLINIFARDEEEFIDKQIWVNVPVSVKYNFLKGRLKPFVYAGFATKYLAGDKANIVFTDRLNEGEVKQQSSTPNLNFVYKRNAFNYDVLIGGGLKRKIGLNYLFAEFRYSLGLNNIVSVKNLYANNNDAQHYSGSLDPVFRYGHVDDYIRLNNFSFSVGFIHPIYKPRKIKTVRIRLKKNNDTN